ncbi:MAG: hypothetical protein JRD43_04285 [Deltaproteobacteria bacterium]|nr:hypothetical protein [Deltaproteobacteria bacterium]MBW2596352.1 hypothetical protein [Deltaproteobacteria bacterium]MBW2651152.1 hypothetical protein [Deltaproteobacteria bacterium]
MSKKKTKTIAVLQIITALGIILFWIGFFTIGLAPETPPPCYFTFEHSFPLPDILLALALLVAAFSLIRGNPLGRTLSLAAAGALIFLGVIDFSFNIQNGMYAISAADAILNGFINAYCVAFGIVVIALFSGD